MYIAMDSHVCLTHKDRLVHVVILTISSSLGNINDDSLENIINNEPYKKLRLDLLNKKRPAICNNCWLREDSNLI